jgi:hypothetical protein
LNKLSLLKKREKKKIDYGMLDFITGIEETIKDSVKLLNSIVLMIMRILQGILEIPRLLKMSKSMLLSS